MSSVHYLLVVLAAVIVLLTNPLENLKVIRNTGYSLQDKPSFQGKYDALGKFTNLALVTWKYSPVLILK
jgi:hypothetical protein